METLCSRIEYTDRALTRAASHLDANGDGCAGNDRGIVVLWVGNIQAALDAFDGDVADGQGLFDLVEVELIRALDADGDFDVELGLVDLQRANKRQRTVV